MTCGFVGFVLLAIVAEVGSRGSKSSRSTHTIVASIILLQIFTRWAVSIPFVVCAEIGGVKMRKKLMAICGVVNMMAAILLTSVLVRWNVPRLCHSKLTTVQAIFNGFGARLCGSWSSGRVVFCNL